MKGREGGPWTILAAWRAAGSKICPFSKMTASFCRKAYCLVTWLLGGTVLCLLEETCLSLPPISPDDFWLMNRMAAIVTRPAAQLSSDQTRADQLSLNQTVLELLSHHFSDQYKLHQSFDTENLKTGRPQTLPRHKCRSRVESIQGGVSEKGPFKILALPKRWGSVWPMPRFFGGFDIAYWTEL